MKMSDKSSRVEDTTSPTRVKYPMFLYNQMASDVEHQAEVMEVSESGLVITQIDKLKFNYDKYNPTRG